MTMKKAWGAAAVCAVVLAGCAGGLEGDDPKGYQACKEFEKFRGDGELEIEEAGAVGISAAEATTDGIREAAAPMISDESLKTLRESNPKVEQIYLINKDKFAAVCAEAGYKFSS